VKSHQGGERSYRHAMEKEKEEEEEEKEGEEGEERRRWARFNVGRGNQLNNPHASTVPSTSTMRMSFSVW